MDSGPRALEERWRPDGLQRLRDLYEPCRRFAGVIGRWDVEPDDLVQEAFAKVMMRSEADIDDLGAYLRRTIANLATDERRKVQRGSKVIAKLRPDAGSADAYPSELSDLMRLDARVRALLYLVEVDGHNIADAAASVDMSPAAARVALMRARRRLRTELTVELSGE
jgi:DNA-directed RNA polymerase specialized sigma24 family protein